MKQLNDKIITWLKHHNIDKLAPNKQYLKIIEEVGELASGLLKNDLEAIKDAIGDIYVALVGYSLQEEIDFSFELKHLYSFHTQETLVIILIEHLNDIYLNIDRIPQILNDIGTSVNNDLTLKECVSHAYNEIKDREIKIIEGVARK